jgi:hypothetical protein
MALLYLVMCHDDKCAGLAVRPREALCLLMDTSCILLESGRDISMTFYGRGSPPCAC